MEKGVSELWLVAFSHYAIRLILTWKFTIYLSRPEIFLNFTVLKARSKERKKLS